MISTWIVRSALSAVVLLGMRAEAAERVMERLTRGVIAVPRGEGEVYVGWRLLGTDPDDVAFNVYRSTANGAPAKLNATPITASTNFVDKAADLAKSIAYIVRPVLAGQEQAASAPFVLPANAPARQYLEIPLKTPAGYAPGDASAGDLDGDGDYELVVHMSGRGRDNAQAGPTDPPILHAYKLNGTHLWTINLGRNVREGAHYTQFMVYDLDGDGIAEVVCKTADGTVDGKGIVIGDKDANWVGEDGKILRGPEYLTVFDGRSGAALATTDYIPPRGDIGGWGGIGGNGGNDRAGNRVDRFLACIAYLDGERPSVVMCRGVYGRSVLAAWDWRGGKLTSRWVFDSAAPGAGKDGKPNSDYSGMGGHSVSVADVDGDGRDEIVYHSMVVDDDGRGLFTTGFRHGDALHVSRFDPAHPNPIVFGIHENEGSRHDAMTPAVAAFDGKTGQTTWRLGDGADAGRCLAADIDPRHVGAEMWGGPGGLRTCRGEPIGPAPRSANFAIWWDGDLLREILDRNAISKWDWENGRLNALFTAEGCMSANGSKGTPALSADLFGDWREEVIFRTIDNKALRVFTTTIPTEHRMPTLMHDPQYRLSIAWQNVAYNQPPHTGFFLGMGMKPPARPAITVTAPATPAAAAAGNPMADGGNAPDYDMAPETRLEVVEAAIAAIPDKIPPGPFKPEWESLAANYKVPQWFVEARFGLMMHWGVYAVPAYHNEWYEKHMYSAHARWHRENFGPHDRFGYKDFIPMFTAEKFDPDAWAELFRKSGARYVIPTAQHHDNFALWDSAITPFNAAKMGPKRDLIGELARAVRAKGLKFGMSNHGIENFQFINPARELADELKSKQADLYDPKWADFYNVADRSDEACKRFLVDWARRNVELIDKYQPDMLWFDNGVDIRYLDPLKLWVAAYYYNRAAEWGKPVSISAKKAAFAPSGSNLQTIASIMDFEKVGSRSPSGIRPGAWQVDEPIGSTWGYTRNMRVSGAAPIIAKLVDTASKNGNLLLNLAPMADGTIPQEQQETLLEIGRWLDVNGEAIHGTHNWIRFSEGSGRSSYRFTVKGDALYVIALSWPGEQAIITSLASGKAPEVKIETVSLLGHPGALDFTQDAAGLKVKLPAQQPGRHAFAFKITGLKMNPPGPASLAR